MEKTYLTLKETAKLVRIALKKNFPGVKFSVRSESFAGGSAIRVNYTDGPLQKAVEKVVNCYAYGGFDGMIDLSFTINHWWNEKTGEVVNASSGGTNNSGGLYESYDYGCPGEGWVKVSFGAKYITVSQGISADTYKEALEITAEKFKNSNLNFNPDLVEISISEYSGNGCLNTNKLFEELGWNSDTEYINNEIYAAAGYSAAGKYYNN